MLQDRLSLPSHALTPARYYADEVVRQRIVEYCGGGPGPPTAAYVAAIAVAGTPHPTWDEPVRRPGGELPQLLAAGHDVARSLWDTESLLVFFDLDYQNIDLPGEPFTHPSEVFVKMEPAFRACRRLFARFGLSPLAVMTGRGYHFTGRIPWDDPLIDVLASLVPEAPAWHAAIESRRPDGITATMTARQARAATGLGLVQEYAMHLLLRTACPASRIPVVVNGTVVGRGLVGRECVSVDLSHLGDPLDVRQARVAFGTYQWHRLRPDIFGAPVASALPLAAIPRGRRPLLSLLTAGRDLAAARRLARRADTRVPEVTRGVERLLADYHGTMLATFHREYLAAPAEMPHPALDLSSLPPCLAAPLQTPNDLLLKPEHLQHLTRGLLLRGWHARQIASLVRMHYEQDHGWGTRWARMEPRTRADYDVRVFAGLVLTGLDRLVDYNCVSAQEKGLCPGVGCSDDLRVERDRFLARGRR
jgi:hypothetical protein